MLKFRPLHVLVENMRHQLRLNCPENALYSEEKFVLNRLWNFQQEGV